MKGGKEKPPKQKPTLSLSELIAQVTAQKCVAGLSVIDFMMQRRDTMLLLLSKRIAGKTIYDSLMGEGMDCTYQYFMREVRLFAIINGLPVRGKPRPHEEERATEVKRRYEMMSAADKQISMDNVLAHAKAADSLRTAGDSAPPPSASKIEPKPMEEVAHRSSAADLEAKRKALAQPSIAERGDPL